MMRCCQGCHPCGARVALEALALLAVMAVHCAAHGNAVAATPGAPSSDSLQDAHIPAPRAARILSGAARNEGIHSVELSTSLGVIVGLQEFTDQPRPFFAFRGIPFAEAPVGRLRWTDPREAKGRWPGGYLDATQHRPYCPQYDHDARRVLGDEDCLFLNVYTPLIPSQTPTKLPVLFFLHGGSYILGAASSLGPQKLLREDIVLVTANYRLGALGFLSTHDGTLPGNYGALDQVAALHWISANIAQFGGDPTRVTLGGFSSGAAFVHLHMMSPLSKDLFSAAILMSGSANCLWSVAQHPETAAYHLAQDLDCTTSSVYNMRECLMDKTAAEIVQAQTSRHRYVYWPMVFRPVVDGGLREMPFLPEPVDILMRQPPLRPAVPLLLGGVPNEGLLYALTALVFSGGGKSAAELYEEASLYTVASLWPNASTADAVAKSSASFYYSRHAREDLHVLAQEMSEAFTDLLFTSCIWDAADQYSTTSRAPVYTYLMDHHDHSSPSYTEPLFGPAEGKGVRRAALLSRASHGDDLALIFSLPYRLGQPSSRDHQMSVLLTNMWATFVHTGSPQAGDSAQLPPWLPLRPGLPVRYYTISFNPGMSFRPFRNKEQNLWLQTLREVDATLEVSYAFSVATWVLLALLMILIVVVVVVCAAVWWLRRKEEYPRSSLTLRHRVSRNPSVSTSYNG